MEWVMDLKKGFQAIHLPKGFLSIFFEAPLRNALTELTNILS